MTLRLLIAILMAMAGALTLSACDDTPLPDIYADSVPLGRTLQGDTLRAKLIWGVPSLSVTFLTGATSSHWLTARTSLRPNWTVLAAFGITLCVGFLYLFLFRLDMQTPLQVALGPTSA
jgi:hypothetical protein